MRWRPLGEIKHSPDLLAVFQGRGRGVNGMGVDNGGWGDPDPWKYVGGVNMFWPPPKGKNVTFFHTKRLLDNSSSLTSWRMKDLCQKWKVKLIFRGAWNSLMAWPDWPRLPLFCNRSTPLGNRTGRNGKGGRLRKGKAVMLVLGHGLECSMICGFAFDTSRKWQKIPAALVRWCLLVVTIRSAGH